MIGIGPALATLSSILERERSRGAESVSIAEDSVAQLARLPSSLAELRSRANARKTAPAPDEETPPAAPRPTPAPASAESKPQTAPQTASVREEKIMPHAPTPTRIAVAGAAPERDEAWRRARLNDIFKRLKQSAEPRDLGSLSETLVFASGNPSASIVFVGEAPGAEEERMRKPFVGPAGQKLEQILKAMALERADVYISNVVKFRPKIGDGRFQGERNRPPTHEEMATCLPFLREEIETLRPRVVVALGRTAAEGLLERGGAISAFRGATHDFGGVPVVVTYHPSYLLRQESASEEEGKRAKRLVWEDMLRVMELAGLPISDRQRRFFQ